MPQQSVTHALLHLLDARKSMAQIRDSLAHAQTYGPSSMSGDLSDMTKRVLHLDRILEKTIADAEENSEKEQPFYHGL